MIPPHDQELGHRARRAVLADEPRPRSSSRGPTTPTTGQGSAERSQGAGDADRKRAARIRDPAHRRGPAAAGAAPARAAAAAGGCARVSAPDPGAPELVVGAWRGYRIWRLAGDRLTGCWYTSYAWAPGGSEACCDAKRWTRKGRRARHPGLPAPQGGCRCGLYALQEPWDFAGYLPFSVFGVTDESNVVIGVVAGWGRAFRGQHGWRTQFARPVALYRAPDLDGEQVERVAGRYGCRVVEGRSDLLTLVDQRA